MLPRGEVNELELLLVAHPGEFNLVGSSADPFLIILDNGLGHDCGGQVVVLGEERRRALRTSQPGHHQLRSMVYSHRRKIRTPAM